MVADKIEDLPTVYIVSETPDTLDKPTFDFSKVSYTEGRAIGGLFTRSKQKTKQIEAALEEDDVEVLFKQFESLTKEQDAHIAKHKTLNKMLKIRIHRLEQRIENWKDADVDALRGELDVIQDELESKVLAGVTYVPQVWLTAGAPLASHIDWSDHASLQYLRGDKFYALIKARAAAQDDSPN